MVSDGRRKLWPWLLLSVFAKAEARQLSELFVLRQHDGPACMAVHVPPEKSHLCAYRDPVHPRICYPYSKVILEQCDFSSDRHQWHYDPDDEQIYSVVYSTAVCLTRTVDGIEMIPCIKGASAQSWRFDQDGVLASRLDTEPGVGFLEWLVSDEFESLPIIRDWLSNEEEYEESSSDDELQELASESGLGSAGNERREEQSQPPENTAIEEQDLAENVPKPSPEEALKEKIPEETAEQGDVYEGASGDSSKEADPDEEGQTTWEVTVENTPWLSKKLTRDLQLVVDHTEECLGLVLPDDCDEGGSCFAEAEVNLRACDYSDNEIWRHDLQSKRLFVKKAGYSFCLTWVNGTLKLLGCFAGGAPVQDWYFARGKTSTSLERGLLRSSAHGIREPYKYVEVLKRPQVLKKRSKLRLRHRLLPGTTEAGSCGYDPVTGDFLQDC